MADVVVAGHLCLDMIPQMLNPDLQLRPGTLTEIGPVALAPGGCVANTGLTLHKLGLEVSLMGCVGDDELGKVTRSLLEQIDPTIARSVRTAPQGTTSYTIVINPPEVDRLFLHHSGHNDNFTAHDIDYDTVRLARIFHFGYPPLMKALYVEGGVALETLLQRAKTTDATVSLDMAMPDVNGPSGAVDWPAILKRALQHVDIFMPSFEEIYLMLYGEAYASENGAQAGHVPTTLLAEVSRRLLVSGPAIVGLKLGEHGLYVRTASREGLAGMGRAAPHNSEAWANREIWAPSFEVAPQGTTGAGDATVAGFLASLLKQDSLEEAAAMATAVGACSVEAADSLSGVVGWGQTLERIQSGWPRRNQELPQGWKIEVASGNFIGPNDQSDDREETS